VVKSQQCLKLRIFELGLRFLRFFESRFKKRKKSRFLNLKKRKKRILELWGEPAYAPKSVLPYVQAIGLVTTLKSQFAVNDNNANEYSLIRTSSIPSPGTG